MRHVKGSHSYMAESTGQRLQKVIILYLEFEHRFLVYGFYILSVSPAASSSLLSSDCSYKEHNSDIKPRESSCSRLVLAASIEMMSGTLRAGEIWHG